MSLETEPALDAPACTRCEIDMEFVTGGTEKSAPIVGSEIEYQQFSCPECGQAARFERADPEEEWSRTGL